MILKLNQFELGRHYHWEHAVFLYTHYDEYDQAANTMMVPSSVHPASGPLHPGSGSALRPWRHWGSQPNCVCPWPVEHLMLPHCFQRCVLAIDSFQCFLSEREPVVYVFFPRGSWWSCRRQPAFFFVLNGFLIASTQNFLVKCPRWPLMTMYHNIKNIYKNTLSSV